MRISDWSSDVCSSDLPQRRDVAPRRRNFWSPEKVPVPGPRRTGTQAIRKAGAGSCGHHRLTAADHRTRQRDESDQYQGEIEGESNGTMLDKQYGDDRAQCPATRGKNKERKSVDER